VAGAAAEVDDWSGAWCLSEFGERGEHGAVQRFGVQLVAEESLVFPAASTSGIMKHALG
jgi:hypothetical protein